MSAGQWTHLRQVETARIKAGGDGLFNELQTFIRQLESGGTQVAASKDPRTAQAKVYWDLGWGREAKIKSFPAFLKTVPPIPTWPAEYHSHFDRTVLVYPLKDEEGNLDIVRMCRLAGIDFGWVHNKVFVPYDDKQARDGVYWMRCQDGRRNRNRTPRDCRRQFDKFEVGCDAKEGVAIFIQDREVLTRPNVHYLDLPGSVLRVDREDFACLGLFGGAPRLDYCWGDGAAPDFGSASRGECVGI